MKVQPINTVNFGNNRFISKEAHKNLAEVLTKMNKRTVYAENGFAYKMETLRELTSIEPSKASVVLRDGRGLKQPVPEENQLVRESTFTIGRLQVVINNKNGEIIDYLKPFFTTWETVMEKISKYMAFFNQNFDNPQKVEKYIVESSGYTDYGSEKMKELSEAFEAKKAKFNTEA